MTLKTKAIRFNRNTRVNISNSDTESEMDNNEQNNEINSNDINLNELNMYETNIEKAKKIIKICYLFIFSCIKFFIKISGVYLLWILLHFAASHMYIKFCVPSSFFGFIISPFMTASPHCQGLRWIIYTGANTINNMWVILGTWLCSYLIQLGGTSHDDKLQ